MDVLTLRFQETYSMPNCSTQITNQKIYIPSVPHLVKTANFSTVVMCYRLAIYAALDAA